MTSGTCCRTRRSASSWTNGKATLKELRELTQLHKLKVAGVSYGNSNELWCAIAGHNQLQSLSVEVEDVSEERYQLDGCLGEGLLPPSYLESLTLCGKLVSITKWIHKLQNLSRLVLTESELEQDDAIQAVGFLPNLAVLRLRANSFMGTQLHFQSSSFPSLVVLELVGLDHIQSVLFEEDAMTKLELLQVDWCQSLGCDIELNVFSGLPALKSLKEIRLGCNGVRINVKEEMQRQVAEHLKHVRLNII